MKGIRLTDTQVIEISKAFRSCFLITDHLWLFGSRTNLHKKGGDIDLFIETSLCDPQEVVRAKMLFSMELDRRLGEQKIDIVVKTFGSIVNLNIYEHAKTKGVKII